MRILIVKIGAIGDVVMALPLLEHFKKLSPSNHITWIAGRTVEPILKATGKVDRIIIVDEPALFKSALWKRLRELIRVQAKIAGKVFDLILIGHVDSRYRFLSFFARSKETRSLERQNQRQCPVPGRYHGNEYLRLATGLDSENFIPVDFPNLILPKFEHLNTQHLTIALAPGGAKNILANDALRRWPIQHYVDLARKFINKEIQVVLTGASSDEWALSYFKDLSCINLIGKLDLLELISLYQNAKLLVTHDSGPLHLAKLARCPVVGLFGPTNPWEKVGRHEKVHILWGGENLSCRPCYDGKTYAPCARNICLESIHPEEVYKTALRIMKI